MAKTALVSDKLYDLPIPIDLHISKRFAYQQAGMSTSGNLDFLWMRTNICINLRWLGSRFSSRVLRLSFKEASQHDLSLNWRIVR